MVVSNTGLNIKDSGLQKTLEQVLQLQPKWDSSNSPDMQERGHLIRDSIPKALRALLLTIPELESSGFRVEGRDGTGRKTRLPWARLFLPTHSPSATEGWYAVYIFASDGSAVYLSLNQGTTTFSKGTLVPKPREEIIQRANRARTLFTNSNWDINGLSTKIELKDQGSLGRGYELGNVYAITYLQGNIPDDDILTRDLVRVLNLLIELYNSENEQSSLLRAKHSQTERSYWFVGAHWGEDGDQAERFIKNGIWENGYKDRYIDEVKSIQPGDRIAIKSTYTRKKNLPFDNKGNTVSVMAIKAVGTVTKNLDDGRRLQVEWTEYIPPHEWYFFTNLYTLWRVERGNWMTDALIDFTFDGKPQDYYRFQNDPFWQERFGNASKIDMEAEANAAPPYTINDILSDGCFIERESLETMLKRLQSKKNMILQGPPGTGKTWLAKRLAFALIGHCDESKVKAMQFHPNLSYEDFVRGWRPIASSVSWGDDRRNCGYPRARD